MSVLADKLLETIYSVSNCLLCFLVLCCIRKLLFKDTDKETGIPFRCLSLFLDCIIKLKRDLINGIKKCIITLHFYSLVMSCL